MASCVRPPIPAVCRVTRLAADCLLGRRDGPGCLAVAPHCHGERSGWHCGGGQPGRRRATWSRARARRFGLGDVARHEQCAESVDHRHDLHSDLPCSCRVGVRDSAHQLSRMWPSWTARTVPENVQCLNRECCVAECDLSSPFTIAFAECFDQLSVPVPSNQPKPTAGVRLHIDHACGVLQGDDRGPRRCDRCRAGTPSLRIIRGRCCKGGPPCRPTSLASARRRRHSRREASRRRSTCAVHPSPRVGR